MFRYPIFKQDDEYSCGAYCLKMILKYYHLNVEIKEIKQRSKITANGISVYGMIQCLKYYRIEAKAYQCDLKTLLIEAKLPCILHLIIEQRTHYVVLYKQTKHYLLIGDPAKGLIKMKVEELEKVFSGVCICIEHVGRFDQRLQKETTFMEFVIKHLKNNYRFVLKLVTKSIIISFCSILSSSYFQSLIDQIAKMDLITIVLFTFIFMIVSFIRIIVSYTRKQLEIEIQQYLNQKYVNKTISNMMYLPFRHFENNQDGVLLTKVTNLFLLGDFFIHLYTVIFMDLILLIGLYLALFMYSKVVAMITGIFFVFLASCLYRYLKGINRLNKKIIASQEIMNQGYLEYLKNVFNSHQFFVKRFVKEKINYLFDEYNHYLYTRNQQLNKINSTSELLLQLLMYLVVLIACFYYKESKISIGDIIFFYLLISYMIEPLFNLISFILEKDEILILYQRYQEILPERRKKKTRLKETIREIYVDHISYSYGYSKPIIEHLDLTIKNSIWLQGDTGAGKSTLLKLLMNYDDLLKGKIYINGIDLKKIDLDSLYHKMIYLDKKTVFYHESLRFNLCLNQRNEKKMLQLLQQFKLEELIDKLDLELNEDGFPLSSGQGQIVMLIRALLKRPEVLILDEALCNVDEKRFNLIMEYLNSLNLIVIIVAHQTKLMNEMFDCVIIEIGKIKTITTKKH